MTTSVGQVAKVAAASCRCCGAVGFRVPKSLGAGCFRGSASAAGSRGNFERGFTLLEVMLALAILVGALAVLGELARSGAQSAKTARDLTRAELLCEGIMNQVAAGLLAPDAVQNQPVVDPVSGASVSDVQADGSPPWVYSITSETIDDDGLLSVTVTVTQQLPEGQHPTSFSLVRWMVDPNLELAAAAAAAANAGSSSSSGSSSGSSGR